MILRKCRFCGSKNVNVAIDERDPKFGTAFFVVCTDCRAQGPKTDNEFTAADAWDNC